MKNKLSNILTKKFLYQEYIINKKSTIQIAKEINCNHVTILNYLKKYNIPIRTLSEAGKNKTLSPKKRLSKALLLKEYITNKKSATTIAEELGYGATFIYNNLKYHDIKIRTSSEASIGKLQVTRLSKILTKKFLIKEYIINKKSITQIAKEVGCSTGTIRPYLKRFNIPIRTLLEACKLSDTGGKNHYRYTDGRSLKQYYCKDCLKKGIKTEIGWIAAVYGKGRCTLCSKIGKNNPNWKDGVSFEPYPISWTKTLKKAIRERDNHQCQICGKSTKKNGRRLDVHHIDYDKQNLNSENLISLCQKHHLKTNTNREYWLKYFKNKCKEIINV